MIVNPNTGKAYRLDYFKDYARGKPCQVRIAAECGHACSSDETVVLAHITLKGARGVSIKVNDLLGAWACDTCHSLIDRRLPPVVGSHAARIMGSGGPDAFQLYLRCAHYDGMARTIDWLVADGVLAYEDLERFAA